MPVLKGSVSYARFQVERTEKPHDSGASGERRMMSRGLKARAFEPLDRKSDEDRAVGFVELEDGDATEFAVGNLYRGEQALFGFRVDTLRVPAAALKGELAQWTAQFQRENDRKPSRQETAQRKEALRQAFRLKAIPVTKVHDVSWNLKSGRLEVWASSRKAVEEVSATLEEAFSLQLLPLTPGARAAKGGLDEDRLSPTPALSGAGGTLGSGMAMERV